MARRGTGHGIKHLREVENLTTRLNNLFGDPETGYSSWHLIAHDLMKELRDELNKALGEQHPKAS